MNNTTLPPAPACAASATVHTPPRSGGARAAQILEWAGCLFGLSGATLLALNNHYSGYGFIAFLLSNACWIGFALVNRVRGLLLMQIGFTATSVVGAWKWLG